MPFEIEFIRNMQRSITELEVGMTKEREQDEKPIAFWDTQEGRLIPAVPLSSERTCFEVPLVPLYLHPRADIGDELVDLLKDVLEEYLIQDEVSEGYGYGVGGEIREKARAALAKARGESHD